MTQPRLYTHRISSGRDRPEPRNPNVSRRRDPPLRPGERTQVREFECRAELVTVLREAAASGPPQPEDHNSSLPGCGRARKTGARSRWARGRESPKSSAERLGAAHFPGHDGIHVLQELFAVDEPPPLCQLQVREAPLVLDHRESPVSLQCPFICEMLFHFGDISADR